MIDGALALWGLGIVLAYFALQRSTAKARRAIATAGERFLEIVPRIALALLTAGFIDTHVHYAQTEMIASPGKQLLAWVNDYIYPAEEAFALYERNWRHVDREHMTPAEADLVRELANAFGYGRILTA